MIFTSFLRPPGVSENVLAFSVSPSGQDRGAEAAAQEASEEEEQGRQEGPPTTADNEDGAGETKFPSLQ